MVLSLIIFLCSLYLSLHKKLIYHKNIFSRFYLLHVIHVHENSGKDIIGIECLIRLFKKQKRSKKKTAIATTTTTTTTTNTNGRFLLNFGE